MVEKVSYEPLTDLVVIRTVGKKPEHFTKEHQMIDENIINCISHQRNVNQNYSEIPLHRKY
jgi:hypothetical protein